MLDISDYDARHSHANEQCNDVDASSDDWNVSLGLHPKVAQEVFKSFKSLPGQPLSRSLQVD